MPLSVFEQFRIEEAGLRVELLVQPAINYALVHNRVPLVRHVAITNLAVTPLTDLALRLELIGPEGSLADGWERSISLAVRPGATIGWEDFGGFGPDMARLRTTDEAFPVDYLLTVTRPGLADVRLSAPSSVLAYNEWFNSPALYDSLAAFVQPNTEAVEAVLRSARQVLLARTGSGSMQGYQAGPERAAQIAGTVYEALRQLGITYQVLPASFENSGQKVRTTAAVLHGRLGNCVDLSVTYAACLEQAGLRPLIWLTRDHAFAGFLLEEERLSSTVVSEANLLISMVESGTAVPVELTGIGPGTRAADFAAAVRSGTDYFRAAGHELLGVVDVYLAHRSGIRPLPSADTLLAPAEPAEVAVPGEGSIDLPPGVARARLAEHARDGDDAPQQTDDSPPRVRQWKKALLDLSLRNPLLNLPKRGKGLDLHVPAGTLALLDDYIHAGKRLEIVPQDDISHIHELAGARRAQELDPDILTRELRADRRIYAAVLEQRYRGTMRGLQRDARTMEQETGSNYLYLTIGTLVHRKSTGDEAHAPLFLLPVRIEGGIGWRPYGITIDGSEIASPNYCLVEWLRVKHRLQIPELQNPIRDDSGIDIQATLAAIRQHLVVNQLNYRIDETASLRLLQFSTFQMWRDLTDRWQIFIENPVVRHLVETTGATFDDPAGDELDPEVDESHLHLPIPADGSQMQAIVMAERGYSFVLEGPPGTGKSQTITNLIARAVGAGRSVLFVAEKQAALDVVKRRLTQVGLAPFTLDLHGRKQSLNAIRQQLRDALEQYDHGDDTTWTPVETGYRARLAPLASYPARIHSSNGAGLTAWSAYEAVLAYGDGPTATIPHTYLTAPDEVRKRVEQMLPMFPAIAHSARLRPNHPWSIAGRRTVDGLHPNALVQMVDELERVRAALTARPELAKLVRGLAEPETVAQFIPAARLAVQGTLPDRATMSRATESGWDQAMDQARAALEHFQQDFQHELQTCRPEIFHARELESWRTAAHEAGKRIFGKAKAQQQVVDLLTPYLNQGATLAVQAVEKLIQRLLDARTAATALYRQITAIGGLRLPPGWLPTAPAAQQQLADAIQATSMSRTLIVDHSAMWDLLEGGFDRAGLDLLERLRSGWRAWRGVLTSGPLEFARWAGESSWYDTWQRDGSVWHASLHTEGLLAVQRWTAVLAHADVLTDAGLSEFRDQLLRGAIQPDSAEEAYRRGVAATALAERLRAGDLEYFDPELHDNHIRQFDEAANQLRAALPEHLPSVIVRRRPFNPFERRGRVADFTAELRRKRGGKSFRELFAAYPDVILALTPCVLVSPASAANFLAPDAARFDLVIFDEASQIRVAEAIGAMGRSQSVVIVGDSRQMPPTSVMQASHTEDEPSSQTEAVPEDLDSILSEAVESGLPQRWLSWHYRSHDESLIAFSNRYYYDNRLSSLPSPGTGEAAGVLWRRVNGQFDRGASRTNQVEAQAIVTEIAKRLRAPATRDDSIGVVTFNVQQRNMILDMLEDSTDPLIREQLSEDAIEPIFVKNLENVQGDERDVILFSLAFSTNPETGQLPLNFGPLSQTGGERRLNVAITRARRQVMLFASFEPEDIDLSRTTAVGTQHLRAYCEMAAAGVDSLGDLSATRQQRRDRIRDEVAAAIRERGYEVATGHGLSDFTVDIAVRAAGASRWQAAIVLDGLQWSRRPTVADRDGAPGLLRTIMGWPELLRFWLPAWVRDRAAFLDRVDETIAKAVADELGTAADRAAVNHSPRIPHPVSPQRAVAAAAHLEEDQPTGGAEYDRDALETHLAQLLESPDELPAAVLNSAERMTTIVEPRYAGPEATGAVNSEPSEFVPYLPKLVGDHSDIDLIRSSGRVQTAVRETLREVIAAEGPVERHRLARITLAAFGFAKTTEDRRASVLALLDRGVLRRHAVGSFAWPPGLDPDTWRGFRRARSSSDRAFEEIAPEEVANAACHALARVTRMAEQDLLRATLELLGYRRKTEKIDRLLRYGLEVAQKLGRIVRDRDGRYRLGE